MSICKLIIVSISVLPFLFSPLHLSASNQKNQSSMSRRQIRKTLRIYRKSNVRLLTPPPVADILIGERI